MKTFPDSPVRRLALAIFAVQALLLLSARIMPVVGLWFAVPFVALQTIPVGLLAFAGVFALEAVPVGPRFVGLTVLFSTSWVANVYFLAWLLMRAKQWLKGPTPAAGDNTDPSEQRRRSKDLLAKSDEDTPRSRAA